MCVAISDTKALTAEINKKTKTKFKNKVNVVLSENVIKDGKKRKNVNTKINGQSVKLLLDTDSDICLINEQTCKKKIDNPPLKNTEKVAWGVLEKRLNFKGEFSCKVSFIEKKFPSKIMCYTVRQICSVQTGLCYLICRNYQWICFVIK